jgi:hypothetical protein
VNNVIFENRKLTRDSIITGILVFNYPFLLYAIIKIIGGDFDFGVLFLVATPVILIMLLHAIRTLRTNIVSIATRMNGSEVEIVVRKMFGERVTYSGWKSEFHLCVVPDKWNRGNPKLEFYFQDKRIATQFFIAFRGRKWMAGIVDAWNNAGMHVSQ